MAGCIGIGEVRNGHAWIRGYQGFRDSHARIGQALEGAHNSDFPDVAAQCAIDAADSVLECLDKENTS